MSTPDQKRVICGKSSGVNPAAKRSVVVLMSVGELGAWDGCTDAVGRPHGVPALVVHRGHPCHRQVRQQEPEVVLKEVVGIDLVREFCGPFSALFWIHIFS